MKEKIQISIISIFFIIITGIVWFKPASQISDSELRYLAQFPEISEKNIFDGTFMKNFERYTVDQFPMRDRFRALKAYTYIYIMLQKDNNKIYVEDNHAAKMEYPLSADSITYATKCFNKLYNKFIANTNSNCYLTVIPDKNYYLADAHGALRMDYDALIYQITKQTPFATYIDIADTLGIENFYYTDPHWNQATLIPVANRIAKEMGVAINSDFKEVSLSRPFYGVYYGQMALPMRPDTMQYLTNKEILSAKVYDHQNNKGIPIYNDAALETRSPYDLFVGGSLSLVTIENPRAASDKELVVFRDSYGSSLAPLLVSCYKKITLCDIRYLASNRVGDFIDFNGQDVLFLYSVSVLNNSSTLK